MNTNREKRLREAYANPQHRRCYECKREATLAQIVAGIMADTVTIESFTGRVFCSRNCWTAHQSKESLLDAAPAS